MNDAIRVDHLTKVYIRYAWQRRFATLKSALLGGSIFRDLAPEAAFPALTDISFRVPRGSTLAVIGHNGSGKSTLLKVLAGILRPTSGQAVINGRVAALLELGAGFHPEVSGRENIIINGIMLGLARREIERRIDEIVAFAELEDFIDQPVKTYSSGMYVRLGFSVAVAVEPDVLLVDEVLAVGDQAFSHKSIDRFHDLRRRGCTILLVTHALDAAEALADAAVLLEGGRLIAQGLPREVIDIYRQRVDARESGAVSRSNVARATDEQRTEDAGVPAPENLPDAWKPRRWGDGRVEITAVRLAGADGTERALFHTGEEMTIELDFEGAEPQTDFVFGIAVFSRSGQLAYGTNTAIDRLKAERLGRRGKVRVRVAPLNLLEGSYSLDVAVHSHGGVAYDYRHACTTFAVRSELSDVGVTRLDHTWDFEGDVRFAPR